MAGLLVLLFLRDWRSALVVVLNIPLSLMGALLALWMTRQTVNIMTLGGLALAVGILVDMSTVVIENIHTHLARGKHVARSVADSGKEVALPLLISMLCVLAVFVPSFFMAGVAKAMFVPLSLAVGFSMVASYLLASTFAPVLAVWFLRGHEAVAGRVAPRAPANADKQPSQDQGGAHGVTRPTNFEKFRARYAEFLKHAVSWRWPVVAVYIVIAVLVIVFLGPRLGAEIFPKVDAGQLQVRLRAPAGTDINGTEAAALQALDIIKNEVGSNNVETTLGFIGVHGSPYPINFIYLWNGGPEEGVLQVQLKPGAPVRIEALKERLRHKFAERLLGVSFSFEPSDIVTRVMSLGSATPIEVAVSGPNLAASREFAEKVKAKLQEIPVLRDVQFGQSLDYPTVDVAVDRQRAGLLGVKMADVSRSLVAATSSSRFVVPNYWADPNSGVAYQIQVGIPQTLMNSIESVENIPILNRHDQSVLLRNIAQVKEGTAVGQYQRYNMQRTITVTANIAGADLGSVGKLVAQAIKELGNPPTGTTVAVRGQVVPLQEMIGGLQTGLLLAVVVIFLLLAANFQSVQLSLTVVATAPAVVAGVVLALWLTGTTLNIQSFMGAIMAIGVAVANAILLVTFAERERVGQASSLLAAAAGKMPAPLSAADAAVSGAASRLRPILMTSLAMMAGMMPMALGLGDGGQQTAPLGRAVVGGLAAATVATLLVLPSVFAIVRGRASRRSASLDPDDPLSSHFVSMEKGSGEKR